MKAGSKRQRVKNTARAVPSSGLIKRKRRCVYQSVAWPCHGIFLQHTTLYCAAVTFAATTTYFHTHTLLWRVCLLLYRWSSMPSAFHLLSCLHFYNFWFHAGHLCCMAVVRSETIVGTSQATLHTMPATYLLCIYMHRLTYILPALPFPHFAVLVLLSSLSCLLAGEGQAHAHDISLLLFRMERGHATFSVTLSATCGSMAFWRLMTFYSLLIYCMACRKTGQD